MLKLFSPDFYANNATRASGFAAGAAVTLVVGMAGQVIFTGQGIGDFDPTPVQVYFIE
ncbi:hypothetical protein ACS3SW_10845 [Roseobacteraceae bacterium S113]